jgi:hypothetical protein
LFCWYCVLFSVNKNPYNSIGYDNLKEIHRALVKQEIPKEYTHSAIKFKLFDKQNIANTIDSGQSGHKEYIKKYNEKVRENREMVKHLINMTIFLSAQELAFRGNDESDNEGNFKELAKFAATLEENL